MKSLIFRQVIIISIALIVPILYFNCSDNSVSPNQTTQFCISAQLSGWIPGNKILYANLWTLTSIYSVANCTVDNQGNFKLCFPASLPDTGLIRADSMFFWGCSGGTAAFTPPDARGAEVFNFRVKTNDSTIVGAVDDKNYTNSDSIKAGNFEVFFIYTNKNVTGSGYKLCGSDTLFFNGTVQTGWNKVVKHYTRVTPTSRTILYDTNEPAGAVWRYHGS